MYLLDTCAWLDAFMRPQVLRPQTREILTAQSLLSISAISPWEVAIKAAKGKLFLHNSIDDWMRMALPLGKFRIMALSPDVSIESCRLPPPFHSDPADCIIVATARIYSLTIVTSDTRILQYKYVNSIPSRAIS